MDTQKSQKINLRINTVRAFDNINIVECGLQSADPFHNEGPLRKTEFVLQYMLGGEGEYTIAGKTYRLVAGDLFYLPKNIMLSYKTNQSNPYYYWWLGFDGELAEVLLEQIGFTPAHPIIHYSSREIAEIFSSIFKCLHQNSIVSVMRAKAYLYELFSCLLTINSDNNQPIRPDKSLYIKQAISYMQHNFAMDLTASDVAHALSLNRTYFSELFKEKTGISPIQYLIKYRMEQASKMLLSTPLSVASIARQCGFKNPSNFTLQFRQRTGYTPTEYRAAKQAASEKSGE